MMASCTDNNNEQPSKNDGGATNAADTTNAKIDSKAEPKKIDVELLYNRVNTISDSVDNINHKIDTLKTTVKDSNSKAESQNKKIASLEKWTYGVAIFCGIALVTFIIIIKIIEDRYSKNKSKIKYLETKIEELRKNSETTISGKLHTGNNNKDVTGLKYRIEYLEKRYRELSTAITKLSTATSGKKEEDTHEAPEPPKNKVVKTEYAGSVANGALINISESKEPTSVFEITYNEGENNGKWTLISELNKVKSKDGIKDVIDFGGGSIETATGFTVRDKGTCKKDGKLWKVITNLSVRLK